MSEPRWEYLPMGDDRPLVRRFPVPGGWLYQTEDVDITSWGNVHRKGWHPPVFVTTEKA